MIRRKMAILFVAVGLVAVVIVGLVFFIIMGQLQRGSDQLSSYGIAIKANYGLFGNVKSLVIARKANSKWPEESFKSWPGNLAFFDARTGEHLVLDIPQDQLSRFWQKALRTDPIVPIVQDLQWLAQNVESIECQRFIEKMLEGVPGGGRVGFRVRVPAGFPGGVPGTPY